MTFRQYSEKELSEWMLWTEWVRDIMAKHILSDKNMEGRWDDDISGYPEIFPRCVREGIRQTTIDYLEVAAPHCFQLMALKGGPPK